MFQANIVPGQGFVAFSVWKKAGGVTNTGRAQVQRYAEGEKRFFGILTNASQREVEQWKQSGHPVSHRIVQHGAEVQALATDYLVMEGGRRFYVQGRDEHAGLGVAMSYFVEERADFA